MHHSTLFAMTVTSTAAVLGLACLTTGATDHLFHSQAHLWVVPCMAAATVIMSGIRSGRRRAITASALPRAADRHAKGRSVR